MSEKINNKIEELKHHIKLICGLPPNRPTDVELQNILTDINEIPEKQRTLTVWKTIIYNNVKDYKKHIYEGADNSDLNSLYNQLLNLLDDEQ